MGKLDQQQALGRPNIFRQAQKSGVEMALEERRARICPHCLELEAEIKHLKKELARRALPEPVTVTPVTRLSNAEKQKRYRERQRAANKE